MVYADSSCLVAMLVVEPRTDAVIEWLARHSKQPLCTADWCVSEVASALAIKVRTKQLTQPLADAAWESFEAACDGLLRLVNVESSDFMLAARLCRVGESGLRAGDALHLAVACRMKCRAMWSLDQKLNLNARANGLKVALA
ncbi:MAG: type II toxin-antitoxin system VapC family toxin [Variovorax sp.]